MPSTITIDSASSSRSSFAESTGTGVAVPDVPEEHGRSETASIARARSRSSASSWESSYSDRGRNIDILDDPEQVSRSDDNITLTVSGSATVTIAGATIECQNNAEINIVRKNGPRSRSPGASEHDDRYDDRPRRRDDGSSRSVTSFNSEIHRPRHPPLPPPFQGDVGYLDSRARTGQGVYQKQPPPTSPSPVRSLKQMPTQAIQFVGERSPSLPPVITSIQLQSVPTPQNLTGPESPPAMALSHIHSPARHINVRGGSTVEEQKASGSTAGEGAESLSVPSSQDMPEPRQSRNKQTPASVLDYSSDESAGENDPSSHAHAYVTSPSADSLAHSNSDSSDKSTYGESSTDSEEWDAICSDEIEPSESASRPGVPRSSIDSSIAPQATMTPPIRVPCPSPLSFVQPAPSSDSSFTCMIGSMPHDGNLQFSTRTYSLDGPYSLHSSVNEAYEAIHGPLMIVIDDWRPWYLQHLQIAFPNFPASSLRSFIHRESASMLPLINEDEELTCITDHVSIDSSRSKSKQCGEIIQLGDKQASCRSVLTWTTKFACPYPEDGESTDFLSHAHIPRPRPIRPLIIIISAQNAPIADKIARYYVNSDSTHERWHRLGGDLNWIYLDTYFLFTKWERVWAAVKGNLKLTANERFSPSASSAIFQQTRQLHEDTDTMMNLHEHLRIHAASLARFALQLGPSHSFTPNVRTKLLTRVSYIQQLLNYYDMTASSLLSQQSNLTSLAFNLETMTQGQAVARLNVLALVFLPLSFAASIFGMTTFTGAVKWYPVFALPLLVITVVVAISIDRYFSQRSTKESAKSNHTSALSRNVKDSDTHGAKPVSSALRLMSSIRRLISLKSCPIIPIYKARQQPHSPTDAIGIPDDFGSEKVEKDVTENSLPDPDILDTLPACRSVEDLGNYPPSVGPSSAMVRDAAVAVLLSRADPEAPETPEAVSLPLTPVHDQHVKPSEIPTPTPLSELQHLRKDLRSPKVRNVAFDIPRPATRASGTPTPNIFESKSPIPMFRGPSVNYSQIRYEAGAYQEDVGGPTVMLTAEILRNEQNKKNATSSSSRFRQQEDSSYSRSSRHQDSSYSRSDYVGSSYSRGASEKGHVPSALRKAKKPRDSDFRYTVVQKVKDSHEVVYEIEPGSHLPHKTHIRNLSAKASTISERKDISGGVKEASLGSKLPEPNLAMQDTEQSWFLDARRTRGVRFVGDSVGRVYDTWDLESGNKTSRFNNVDEGLPYNNPVQESGAQVDPEFSTATTVESQSGIANLQHNDEAVALLRKSIAQLPTAADGLEHTVDDEWDSFEVPKSKKKMKKNAMTTRFKWSDDDEPAQDGWNFRSITESMVDKGKGVEADAPIMEDHSEDQPGDNKIDGKAETAVEERGKERAEQQPAGDELSGITEDPHPHPNGDYYGVWGASTKGKKKMKDKGKGIATINEEEEYQ
ncbi:hypothetical protein BKA65DRAFT_578736 [Rhexocercosporidium sp. MPI-PUGE-AT-0058]|nr:hypothetical protein BKA65DRAFT_578736 [Rhexocercosporidium sp. MPI-PUGE-AT-0058]